MKLKTKIIFSVIIIFLLIDFFFTYVFVNNTRQNLLDKLNTKIENTTTLINQVNSAPLYDIDIKSLENNLKSFLNDEDIQAIMLKELNGSISLEVGNFNIDKNQMIKKYSTITYNEEIIGNITTYYSTKKIDDNMKEYINENITLSLVAAIAVSLMLYFLLQNLIRPITNLTKVASNITGGNLDEYIEITNNDEVGDLAKQFEIMRTSFKKRIDTINDKNKEIKSFNDKLEIKIDNRTKELLEQKEVFERLFKDSSDGALLIKDGLFIDCNSAVLEALNYKTKDEFLNIKPSDISPIFQPDGQKSSEKEKILLKKCLEKGATRFEWLHLKKTGENIWFEIVLTKIKIHDEIIIHVLWRNIEDKKQLEVDILNRNKDLVEQKDELEATVTTLKMTQDKLIEAEKMSSLGVLVAGIAHEVNTPIGIGLTGITHFLEITKKLNVHYENDNMSQEEFEEYLKTSTEIANLINSNLHRTAQLIKNFKQISFDQSSEEKRKFNLKEYIEEILFSIHNVTRKTNIKIINTCDEDTDIYSFPGAISQVMTNLIINSIRHGFEEKQSGTITINAQKQEQVIELIYTDNGRGIPKENLSKIFDPFFTTNREKGGTGLGLNILYNIVSTTLHGTIKCISEENKGVKFIILFQENEKNDKIEKEILWQI
jgi:signal transduction histidine kinase/HAMP domain-containing protein